MKLPAVLCVAIIAAFATIHQARSQQQHDRPPAPPTPSAGSVPRSLTPDERSAIAQDLIARWQNDVRKQPAGDVRRWSTKLTAAVTEADPANLLLASTMNSLERMHAALAGEIRKGEVQSKRAMGILPSGQEVLGSYDRDLTYTPLPNGRCRIADSRVINSALAGNTQRNLIIASIGSYEAQGGNGTYAGGNGSTNCGILTSAVAYVVSVTLLSPAGNGVFKVFESGKAYQTGNSILFNAGDFGANGDQIVKNCRSCATEISIQSSATVHYVIDVVGYFHPPAQTALNCYFTAYAKYQLGAGAGGAFDAPACTYPSVVTSTSCFANEYAVAVVGSGQSRCDMKNWGTTTAIISTSSRCCLPW